MPDPLDNIVQLSDRVKELSYTEGTGNMSLEGSAAGFSAFSGVYAHSGLVYYAITDGINYEVGSGHYLNAISDPAISTDEIRRYPFTSSSTGNAKVSWVAGTKEVYVTYPAAQSVYTANGVDPKYTQAASSGLAFWEADNTLNYDSSGIWDRVNKRLGVHTDSPESAIHVGGDKSYSLVTASGLRVDVSGVVFSGVSYATRQTEPFLRTKLDDYPTTITNATGLLATSGVVDEYILLITQTAGQVFASPADDCVGGCEPGFPSFRALHTSDIPDLSDFYVTTYEVPEPPSAYSGVAFYHTSGVLGWDSHFVWDSGLNRLGVGIAIPEATLHVGGHAIVDNGLIVKGDLDVRGDLTYINSSTVTIDDKNLELASLSGVAKYMDNYVDTGGISILSSGDGNYDTGDKRWYWENLTNTWKTDIKRADASTQAIGITTSGIIFENGTQISGAYVGGSGLSINGFSLDVGNMFVLKDAYKGTQRTTDIHQADNIVVSGVSGINTYLYANGANDTLTIDGSDLQDDIYAISGVGGLLEVASGALSNDIYAISGVGGLLEVASGALSNDIYAISGVGGLLEVASGTLNDDMISSGVAISGWVRDSYVSNVDLTQVSGTLDTRITNSGVAVSGWARDYADTRDVAVSGWARDYTMTASGYLNSDMIASGTAILNSALTGETNQNAFSYISSDGYTVPANAKTDTFIVASGHDNSVWASGNGVDTITISGAHNFFLRGDSDAGAGGSQVLHNDAVTMSGGYGITTTRAGDSVTVAWSGASYVDAGDAAANAYTDTTSGTLNADMISSGLAVSGWARDYADTRVLATGVAANAYTDTTSGTLNADMISSGVAVSGWARDYTDARVLATGVAANAYTDTQVAAENLDMIASGVAISGWVRYGSTYDWLSDPGTLTAMTDTTMEGDDTLIIWDEGNSLWKKVTLSELDDEIGAGADVGDVNEFSFKTISVALQDSVVAENDADELTLVGGTNVTITTDAGTDTITFTTTDTTYSVQDGELSQNNFTNADHTKLDGIEASATADQSNAEIKTAIEAGADIALGGNPTTTTQAAGNNSTRIATTAYADAATTAATAALVDSAPGTLDTLNELAAALGDDVNFSTTVTNSIATKMPLAGGAFTGAVTTNSTFDGVDIATRDAVLTSTTTTADAALPKAGGAMVGAITTNSTFDGRDVAVDGAKLDGIEASATADQTAGEILTLLENGIDSDHYVDGSIDTEHIGDVQVTTGKIALDAIDGTLIANNAINSEHYAAGSIDNEHLAAGVVNSDKIAAGAIDLGHMSPNSVDSDQYVDGSIDLIHMSADSVDGTKIADNSIDTEHYADNSIDAYHITGSPTEGQILSVTVPGSIPYARWVDNNTYTSSSGIVVRDDNGIQLDGGWYTRGYSSMNLGYKSDAYDNGYTATDRYNLSVGHSAGLIYDDTKRGGGYENTFIGHFAGYDRYRGEGADVSALAPRYCISIGFEAGAMSHTAKEDGVAAENNIFIGRQAGRNVRGVGNLSIGSFEIADAISGFGYIGPRLDYKLNIANTIAGDISTDSAYKHRVAIGAISATWGANPIATLELKGDGNLAAASSFHIARSTSTQAGPFFTAETVSATYNGSTGNVKNEIVNKDGFLRIPIFDNLTHLKNTLGTGASSKGVIAVFKDNDYAYVVYSDGLNWRKSGTANHVI